MNCNIFKENLLNLFDEDFPKEEKKELLEHIENCDDCKHEYEELKELIGEIKPSVQVIASKEFKTQIIDQIKTETAMKTKEGPKTIRFRLPKWTKYVAVAAIIVTALIISPFIKWNSVNSSGEVSAANRIFDRSIAAMMSLKSVYYNLNIRTLEQDNFEMIFTDEDFVKNEIWKRFSTPEKWKIAKSGREVLMDGKNQYLYVKDEMAIKAGANAGFVEWLQIMLEPTLIMETEKNFAQNNKAEYTIEEKNNKTILTVKAKALGDFKNDYLLNKSILESNNTRIYTFDKTSNMLESMQIYIQKNNKNILVVETKDIKYNINIPDEIFAINLPENMNWSEVKTIEVSKSIKDLTCEEAANMFFKGCENSDWDKVQKMYPISNGLKEQYGGLKLIRLGKTFKSGSFPGVFIPYEIKFKSGGIKKWNIALRNDNKEKIWQVDGGI
jgi:outer membrane lipoprotein-sorting protein